MTDVQAALGIHQLPHLDDVDRRGGPSIWERYDELLADLPSRSPAARAALMRHARHLYTVLVRPEARVYAGRR